MSLRSLRSAVEFLTVVPVGRTAAPPADRLGRAYFPAIGAVVGLGAGIVFMLATAVVTPLVAGVAAIATAALLTGGLHLDGLADCSDGLLGGGSPERRLEIMRDPRVGSFGAIALVVVLAGDIALLGGMTPARAFGGLVVAGALSRLALLAVVALVPYARSDGLGVAVTGGRRVPDLAIGALLTLVACLLDLRRSLVAALVVAVATLLVVDLARRRIGGATGDVYGACTEIGQWRYCSCSRPADDLARALVSPARCLDRTRGSCDRIERSALESGRTAPSGNTRRRACQPTADRCLLERHAPRDQYRQEDRSGS